VAVDVVRVGRSFRALRLRLGLRQRDVAARAGVSQQHVSDLERGQLGRMSFDAASRLFAVLDARLVVSVSWRGAQLDRLLDEAHAAVVAATVTRLQADGWEVLPEVTYAVYRERGSIDILAWHASSRTLLVVEVKTEIASAKELLRRHDEKVRLAPGLGRQRFGAPPLVVCRLLVVADTSTNRRRVARLEHILAPVYRLRGSALRQWLRRPSGPMGGLLFADVSLPGASTAGRGLRRSAVTRPSVPGPSPTNRGGV
jgi:transcriptional regulator with XRE-family HTH domain